MKYVRKYISKAESLLVFEDGTEVRLDSETGKWSVVGLRRPTIDDLQAICGIILSILTLPVATQDEK